MIKNLFFIMVLISLVSCDFMDDVVSIPITSNCDEMAVEDATRFSQISTANYQIDNVVLNGDCLEVTIEASGCNPDNWDMNLIGAKSLAAVFPPNIDVKVELINKEACLAVFQKTVSFDLTPLQTSNSNQVQINIDGWNTPIIYQY